MNSSSFFHPQKRETKIFDNIKEEVKQGNFCYTVDANGDEANIVFTNASQTRVDCAKLKVYTLQKLRKTEEYKISKEIKIEPLVHVWMTYCSENTIIKYAGENQQAFIFSASCGVNQAFENLPKCLTHMDYFHEREFVRKLRERNQDISQFRDNAERLHHAFACRGVFMELLDAGITIDNLISLKNHFYKLLLTHEFAAKLITVYKLPLQQFILVSSKRMKECLVSKDRLDKALKFVTIQQLLRLKVEVQSLEFLPSRKSGSTILVNQKRLSFYGKKEMQPGNQMQVSHKNEFITTLYHVEESLLPKYEEDCRNVLPIEMVNKWYKIRDEWEQDVNVTEYYCRELQQLVHEEKKNFDQAEFVRSEEYPRLRNIEYYREKDFVEYLQNIKCDISIFRNLEGMSHKKMQLLCYHLGSVKFFLAETNKITINDLARVDENRLQFVFLNVEDAKEALHLIDILELFDLQEKPRSEKLHVSGFYSSTSGSRDSLSYESYKSDGPGLM